MCSTGGGGGGTGGGVRGGSSGCMGAVDIHLAEFDGHLLLLLLLAVVWWDGGCGDGGDVYGGG